MLARSAARASTARAIGGVRAASARRDRRRARKERSTFTRRAYGSPAQDVVAQGSFGNGGTLDVSAGAHRPRGAAALQACRSPVALSAVARVGGTATRRSSTPASPRATYARRTRASRGLPIDAAHGAAFCRRHVATCASGSVVAGPAVGDLDGTIAGLRDDPKQRALRAVGGRRRSRYRNVRALVARAAAPRRNARCRRARHGSRTRRPSVRGRIAIPEGSLNGLAYRDATRRAVGRSSDAVRARGGTVTVGSSTIGFGGDFSKRAQSLALRAPHIELTRLQRLLRLRRHARRPRELRARAAQRARPARARRTPALDRDALPAFRPRRCARRARHDAAERSIPRSSLGSAAGEISAGGNVTLAAHRPLARCVAPHVARARRRGRRTSTSACGFRPRASLHRVVGKIDAHGAVAGTVPRHRRRCARGALIGGVVQAHTDPGSVVRRARRTPARDDLECGACDRQPSGQRLGLGRPATASAVRTDADRARRPMSARSRIRLPVKRIDASGALRTTAHVTGTTQRPLLTDTLDADQIRYARFTVAARPCRRCRHPQQRQRQRREPRLNGRAGAGERRRPAPRRRCARRSQPTAPLAFTIAAQNVDLGQFGALFPKGTQAAGMLARRRSARRYAGESRAERDAWR